MAQTFNLTAQINLRGPANIKPIVASIKKQLGGINTNVNIKLDAKAARNIDVINNKLKALNATLIQASRNSRNLASSLASIGAAAQNLSSLNKVNSNVSNITNNVNSSGKALKQASSEMENFGKQSALAVKRFAAFSVVTVGVYGLVNAISQGARAFLEFDKQLIRLQQVTKSGAVGIRELEAEIRRLAVGLGVSSESLTQVAVTLAQAGLSATETKQALEALAKTELAPSFDNITDTTEGAIAAMRQFGISANELESALGSINAVAAAFAVESGDIISAIQRTGGVFAAASKGVSEGTDALNEFIAVFTSVRATTRESAETIATGLRTIFTRIQRGSTIDFLREFGIELTDIEGKFVGPYEAIKRLSEGLKSLDPRDLRFSKIVEELGGFRQISKVIPLLQQFGDAQKALSVAQGGTGSLAAAQAKAQLSLANQIARVREEFLELVAAFSKSETLQSIFSIVIGLTRGLIKLTSAFKPILPLLAVLGAVKGAGAIAKFGKGFFGNFKKGGGASAAGSTLGQTVTGSSPSTTASPLDAAALNALTQAVTANSGALNSSTTALNSLMTPLSTLTTSVSGLNTSFGLVVTPLSVLDASVNNLDNSIKSLIVKIDNIGGGGTTLNGGGKVLAFARGGVVPGSGNGDTVPAMLQPGEFVIRKKAVETIGSQNLHSMNKYAKGGIAKIKNKEARDGDSWSVDYIPSADPISVTTRGIGYDAYEINKGQKWEKKLGQIAKERADLQFRDNFEEMSDQTTLFASIQQGKFAQGRPLHSVPDEFRNELITMGVAKPAIKENTATGSGGPTKVQLETLKNNNYNIGNLKPQEFLDGGWVERMQQQKKSSLVNAATQLEYWIDKIYAGTEEVGFSPSFKGGKNPSEQVDFKELQERLAAIDELLNAPVSSAKAKKSGLKSAGGYEPEELLDAVKLYQGGSGPLTRAMANQDFLFIDRKEQYDTEDVVARLQAASQYQTRKKLYSGLGKSQFYETLKDTGLSEDDISDQNKVKSIVGKTIDFPTFLSTSYKKDVATAFVGDPGAMMEISTAKAKTSGIDINKAKMTSDSGKPTARRLPGIDKIPKEKLFKYDDEDEFILPPNTAFKVKQASTNKITAKSEDGEEWDVIMGMGGDGQTPLMDLAVQMLNKGGVARYAVGGEVQSAADKLGLGQNDRWWRGSIMGRDSIFDYASPLYAYDAISGEQYKLDQVAVQVFKKKAEKEHLDMVEARQKERQAGGSKVSAEEMATAEAAGDFGAVLRAERDIKSQQASQRAVDSNFRGDFEKRSAGESTFRQKMTPQERRDYYTKRITGYMAGGVTEESDISPNLQQLLDRIAAIGGPKTATELAGYPSGSMSIRKVLNKNSLLTGKNIPQAEAIVAKAEEAYRTKQNAKQSAIDAANEFALVGAYPLGYSKDYGPEDIGGLSTFFTARGLPFKYQQEIDEIAADVRDLPSRAAEKIQMKDIFGTGTRLAFDLDDTLITDADIFKPGSSADPDIPAYSDVSRVTEALKQAKLTRLGEVLRSKLTETPQLLEDIRILTARPQNNAEAVSARLTQLGLAISADKISGVSGATNKVDNLSELETLIDDRLATIEQVNKAGKSAIHYEPIKGYDPSSASGTKAAQVVEGYAIEGLMERLGVPIVEDDANRAIDYPNGLGAKASIWGVKSNVPTDVKRTMDGDAFGRFRGEIERYYSENVQALASGGPVKLYHGSNSGPDDSILNSFKEKGILSNIASGYGQGSGFFMWSDKNSAVKHAKNLVDPNSNMTTSATTGGRPMVVEATETLDPKNWDLDYELQNKDIIDYIHANFDSLKPLLDKSQGVDLGDGLKNFQFRNKINEYTDPNDNTTMRKVQIGFDDNGKEVRRTLVNTTGDIRTGQVVGKLVGALRMGDPDVLDAFENNFFSNLQAGTALKYVGSSPIMPSNIETFALGGRPGLSTEDTVPALLTPGEFVINKKAAATIGYGKLNKLNKADKLKGYNKGGIVGGIQSFADGGDVRGTQEWADIVREMSAAAGAATSMADLLLGLEAIENDLKAAGKIDLAAQVKSVAVGFATSNFDSLAESLTSSSSGRETLEEGAAAGDETSVILDRLADAIERNINIQELFASSAEEAGVSVQKFTKDVKSQILDKTLSNVSGREQSRASLRTEFARSKLLDFSDPAKVDKQREALKSSLGGLISDPAQLNKAVNDLITGAQNGSVSLQDIAASSAEVALALNSSIDRQEALNAATTELEDTLGGLTDAARATVDELESFEYGKSGQATKDFGFAGGINPEAALDFKNSSFGGRALGIAKDFQNTAFLDRLPVVGKSVGKLSEALSELDGPIGKAYRAVGGLPGALAAVAVAAGELLPTILEKMGASQSELGAGIGGALSGGGSRAIALGTLGNQLAGPIGSMIGIIGGAISGALEGFMTGTETKKLENSLNALAKTTEKVAKAFKYLSENNNQNNLNNARAANDEIISAQRSLEYQGESSAGEKLARGASGAVVGLTGVGIALAGLAAIGVTITLPLAAVALGLGAIGAAIYNAAGFTSGDNEAFSASLDAATKYVEGLATLSKRRVESFSLEDITESLDNYRNFQENLDQQVRVGDISQQDASIRRQQYFADNAGGGPTLEEAQRSALRRRGYSIDDNQSVTDFVAANPGAGTVANDAANAAARTLALDEINRTLGADTTAARAEITRLGSTGLERRGRELAGEQDIQLMQTQNLAIITRELNKETENLNQSYDRALAAITRFNQQLDQLDLDLEYGVGMLTGDGRFGQVDRTQENMLKNMTAYTPEELDPVIQNVVNLAGGTPEAEKLGNSIRANNIIENILPDILRRVENGDIEEVGKQLQAALQSGGISEDSAKALATEVKTSLNNETTGNRQGVSFNELLKDFPAFQATLQSTQKAQEVGIAILEAQNSAYQKVNDNLNKFSNLLKKAEDYERKAADIRLQGALELRRTFGDLISLEDLNAPFNAQVESLGGVGSSDPVLIAEGIRQKRTKAEQIRKELAAPGVGLDADKTKALNLELEELQRGSTNAYEALEKLANDGSNAANALSKIEENRQYGRNVIDFVRRISTQSGADAVEMNRSLEAFNRTLDGSLNFGNVKERRLAYEGMDTILPLIRNTAFGRQAEADFNINMLSGQGVNVNKPDAFGSGQTLKELIQSGTTGVDANTTALIEQYRKSIEVQAIAAVQLAKLNREAAYLKVLPKIEIILLSLAQQLPSIIADAMLGNNITLPDNIVTLNNDADAAEAESRRISTTQAALLQAINEWEVATLEGTPLRGDEAANITRLYDELGWTARITQGPYQGAAFPNAMQDIEQQRIAAVERAQTARATATRATDDYTNEQRLQRDINRQDLFNPTTINAMAEANGAMALQDATRDAEETRSRVAAAVADIPVNPAAPAAGAPPAGARVPPAALPVPAPAAASAPAAVVNPAIFDRLAATLPQIDMQMLNVVNSMTVLSNGVIKLDATIALLQTELARDNGFSQSVTNFTETTRTFGGHVDTFTRKIDTFGTYVDKLDKAVGSLSNATITMGGNYTVDVRVSGAAAFTAIEDKTKDLINKEIDLAMGEMVAKINRATGFNLDLNRRT